MSFITIDPTQLTIPQRQLATKYFGKFLGLGRDATKAEIEAAMGAWAKGIIESEQTTEQRVTLPPVTTFTP